MSPERGYRTVTIHQPEHLPWLGFFAKMDAADLFVSLDSVPFRKAYFQNRNRVLGPHGRPLWVTVPVCLEGYREGEIRTMRIATHQNWRKRYLRTIEQRYSKHPYFEELFEPLARVIEADWAWVADLNHRLIDVLRERLGIDTPMVRSSDLGVTGSKSELLASICAAVGAEVYLSGPSGRDYLMPSAFEAVGVGIAVHDYDHPTYSQRGTDAFVSHLSVVDLLFNCEPGESLEVIRSGRRLRTAVEAGIRAVRPTA